MGFKMLKGLTGALCFVTGLGLSQTALGQVRLGVPYPETGPIVELAANMKKAVQLAQAQVNAQGGVLGQEMQLIFADTGCNPDTAVAVVKTMVEEQKVPALIGPVCSGATLRQARSVSIPAGVVTLSGASASPLITVLRDKDLVFRTAVSDAFKGRAMAAYAYDKGIRSVAISAASDAYNTGVAKVFEQAFTALGGSITVNQSHEPDKPSYEREGEALAAGGEALALFAYYGSSGNALLRSAFDAGDFKYIFAADGMLADETIEALGNEALANTFIFAGSSDRERAGYQAWAALAEAADIPAAGTLLANMYDSSFMMALAIEAAGGTTGADIVKGLRLISGPEGETIYPGEYAKAREILAAGGQINYDGASGPVDFDEKGDIVGFVSVNRAVDGVWVSELIR